MALPQQPSAPAPRRLDQLVDDPHPETRVTIWLEVLAAGAVALARLWGVPISRPEGRARVGPDPAAPVPQPTGR
ncbi:MAG TPA: hypothetical protein VGI06_10050 [Acidimicrobiales bacterium]